MSPIASTTSPATTRRSSFDLVRSWNPLPGTDTYRLARHALRTLLKRADSGALAVLGFKAGRSVELTNLTLEPAAPRIGGSARLTFTITSTLAERGR